MNSPRRPLSPLLYFMAPQDLKAQERQLMAQYSAQSQDGRALAEDAQILERRYTKELPATLSKCPDAMSLARFLQGRLDPNRRERFLSHVTSCDDCLQELAFAMRPRPPAPVRGPLAQKLESLFQGSVMDSVPIGRSRDIFGEASISGDNQRVSADALSATVKQPLRASGPGAFPAPGRRSIRPMSQFSSASSEFDGGALLDEDGSVRSTWKRNMLFALIGSGTLFIFGVIPFFRMTKELFYRARKAEIGLAKARKYNDQIVKDNAKIRLKIKKLLTELKRRPTPEAYERQKRTHKILSNALKQGNRARLNEQQRFRKRIEALKNEHTQAIAKVKKQAVSERDNFPDRFFQAIAGRRWSKAPKNAELIELVQGSDDQVAAAAFYTLHIRKLGPLALALAQKRSKFTLIRFLARPYLTTIGREDRLAHLITFLLNPDPAVREVSLKLIRDEKFDTFAYKVDMNRKRRNIKVAEMAAQWSEKYKRPFPIAVQFNEDR